MGKRREKNWGRGPPSRVGPLPLLKMKLREKLGLWDGSRGRGPWARSKLN